VNYAINVFLGQVDILRTPVYPYFIKFVRLFGNENLYQNIIIFQSIISFLSIILFYKIAVYVFKTRPAIIAATFVYGIYPFIINFDKCILTESISISGIVLLFYLIVNFLNKPSAAKAVLLTLFIFVLIMLRPAFLFLVAIITLFWVFRIISTRHKQVSPPNNKKPERNIYLSGLIASGVCALLLLGYSRLNYFNNGCNNISVVTEINQLNILIDFNIYMDKSDPEISGTIKKYLNDNSYVKSVLSKDNNAPNIMWNANKIVFAQFPLYRINNYILGAIAHNSGIYIKKTLLKMFNLHQINTTYYYAGIRGGILTSLIFAPFNIFPVTFMIIYLLLFFDFIIILINVIKWKRIPWLKLFIWSVITGELITTATGAVAEFQRLFVPAFPYIIILIFGYIDILIYSIDKTKLRNYLHLTSE
jgi:hypothetical protein